MIPANSKRLTEGSIRAIGFLFICAFAAAYYSQYIFHYLNIADDGNYVQVIKELMSGTPPGDIWYIYGLFWYKIGEFLTALFGPAFLIGQVVFFAFMALTAAFVFAGVHRITHNGMLATLAGLLAALVPNFPPAAFYGFCTLINFYTLTGMALRWRRLSGREVAPAAAALAITFLMRADFGYAFSLPFLGLLVLTGFVQGGWRLLRLAAIAVITMALVVLPFAVVAAQGGYLGLVVDDVLSYSRTIAQLLFRSSTATPVDVPEGAGTLLQRPPVATIWEGSWEAAGYAFAVYAPVVGLAAFALVQVGRAAALALASPARAFDHLVLAAALFVVPLASFPHYMLFRPDLPHVANFMPGYIALMAIFAWQVSGGDILTGQRYGRARRLWLRLIGWLFALVIGASLALYGAIGLILPGTGAITRSYGADQPFQIATGETRYVTPADKALLSQVKALVEAHSAPGERIVCLPFCPGIAFISDRRMLLREFYADDSFLLTDPGWIDRTIAKTLSARTPVVVVYDWAVNATDISRVPVWAKRYLDALLAAGYRAITVDNVTVYVRPEAPGAP
ncbi:hypothetical protein AncyloWKF20_20195 [Ancylobacter sp. WKF20]|uniref:hypothetical protein n=1 Tax=Ancylobacter sp. WKF20 TaxID=3039801 RepID=UPI0024344AA4|nr:hypothetical protein [Ancylobacter sp. WKF20]WGD30041.1 hypothetical protein AncyloWKF20_20195 [Ancylobacter sp. WKF20]